MISKKVLTVTLLATIGSATAFAAPVDWSFDNAKQWGEKYTECLPGGFQSPINIQQNHVNDKQSVAIVPDLTGQPTVIKNPGYTIQVNFADNGKDYFMIGKQKYLLRQFHFHGPSENTLDGHHFPLEAHFVTENPKTKQFAVVAVFFKPSAATNPTLATLWQDLPKKGQTISLKNTTLNIGALLPKNLSYYHFEGSLTTPPCTRGIQWYVLKTPMNISKADIDKYKALYSNNRRPVQSLNDRKIVSGK